MRPGRLLFVKPGPHGTGGSASISDGLGRLLIVGLLDRRGQPPTLRSPGAYHVALIERVDSRRSINTVSPRGSGEQVDEAIAGLSASTALSRYQRNSSS